MDYSRALWGGTVDFAATASRNLLLTSQATPTSPVIDAVGVLPVTAIGPEAFANGDIEWKGNAQLRWSNDRASLGIRARYFDSYFLNISRTVDPTTATAEIESQTYFDVFGSYRVRDRYTLRAGVNNVFTSSRLSFGTAPAVSAIRAWRTSTLI